MVNVWTRDDLPAVTRAEVEKAVRSGMSGFAAALGEQCITEAVDAVHALVSGDDPAVFVVRESDVAAVEVERDSHDEWFADGEHIYPNSAEDARNLATGHLRMAVRRLAVARAIEAEQDTDPLLDKAQEYLTVMFDYEEPDSASPAEWKAATQMARHVLGQGASDE